MDALFWEMEQMEFEANKTEILSFTSQRELEAYEKLNAEIGTTCCCYLALYRAALSHTHALPACPCNDRRVDRKGLERDRGAQDDSARREDYPRLQRGVRVDRARDQRAAVAPRHCSVCRLLMDRTITRGTDSGQQSLSHSHSHTCIDCTSEIAIEEKRSSDAVETAKAVDSKLELRTKQFAVLMSTIQNLKATLDEDVEMEEAAQRQLADDMDDGDDAVAAKSPPLSRGDDEGASRCLHSLLSEQQQTDRVSSLCDACAMCRRHGAEPIVDVDASSSSCDRTGAYAHVPTSSKRMLVSRRPTCKCLRTRRA